MPLLFDLSATQPSAAIKRHGGGKYCEMLFFAMCQRELKFQAFWDSSRYINPEVLQSAKKANIQLHDIRNTSLDNIAKTQNITHIYSALPEGILPWPNCKILGTVHGLRSLEMPFDFFSHWQLDNGFIGLNTLLAWKNNRKHKSLLKTYYKELLNRSNFDFVTVSNHSKRVIQEVCGKSNIPVFYPPSTTIQTSVQENKEKYFLLVSADRIEKNCTRAIIALDQLISAKKISSDFFVKITGCQENKARYRIRNKDNFRFLGYIEEDELNSLYANAFAFIYPSLNEGFGYPPLEAMKFGSPVLASNAASIPEVCGNAALYFNPTSINEIKLKILDLLNEDTYANLKKTGLSRFKEIEAKQNDDLNNLIDWIIYNSPANK
ncbi:MAG: glycosyltransferase [Fibrobacter sp.]|nr:glycosyltransferase [Fibrobacter sp.]